MTKPDTILFDLGHTLIDFRARQDDFLEVYGEVYKRLAKVIRGNVPLVEEMVAHLPKKISDIIDDSYKSENPLEELKMSNVIIEAFESVGIILPEELVEEMILFEHDSLSRSMILADGAPEVLAELKRLGFKLGLVSNATNLPALMRRDLERLGLLHHFDATVFSSEVGLRKPHPTIYKSAIQGVGTDLSTAIFVGDRIREDVRGPQSLGMLAVLTHQFRQENPDGSKPEGIIKDIVEILDLAKKLRPK